MLGWAVPKIKWSELEDFINYMRGFITGEPVQDPKK
jgi:hypothetical protein